MNKLATNTIKHAIGDYGRARLTVQINFDGNGVCCEFRDDGAGYPEAVLQLERRSAGFNLIANVVRDSLRGELSLHNARVQ